MPLDNLPYIENEIEYSYNPETNTHYWGLRNKTPDKSENVPVQGGEFRVDRFYETHRTVINVKQTITTEKDMEYFRRQQAVTHPFFREDLETAEVLAKVFKKGS